MVLELILHPHKEESGGSGAETHEEPEEHETADESRVSRLEEALADSKACNEQLEAEVSHLSGELVRVMSRVDEMWKSSVLRWSPLMRLSRKRMWRLSD